MTIFYTYTVTFLLLDINCVITSAGIEYSIIRIFYPSTNERANRSKNVLIFGVKDVNQDENSVEHIITNELNLQVRPTSVSRLGKGNGGRPASLPLKFSTSDDAASVIKSGTNLRFSTDNDIKSSVFISPDYTKLERHEQFILRSELRRRRAAGENNLIIRNGSIVTRRQTP